MSPNCPDIIELERFLGGELGAEESSVIEGHASGCPPCRERLADIRENLQLVAPVRQAMARADAQSPLSDALMPTQIGTYRILREIGRGGMGIVYEAEQPNPRRRVALKILHSGFGPDDRIERMFRREAQALARLKHPSIAAVYEAGRSEDGRSYLAMELVHGLPITQFAAERRLGPREKLNLFARVCDAVQHAHQKGVIHRDLKPSNILVVSDAATKGRNDEAEKCRGLDASSVHGFAATPKILDFGLAKILDPEEGLPAVTSPNEAGRIQGTLPYMSPEQVRGDLHEVDVRSDVYSLGVVLYEMLCERLPYPIDRARLTESARTICEQPPARPSTVDRALAGDIETIILKALEKEPNRRYSYASAFSDDIARWLADQPILARPPTLMYQVRKLIARHKAAAALLAVMLVLVVGAAVTTGILYARANANLNRAQEAEQRAQAEATRARDEAEAATQIKDFIVDVFKVSDPGVAKGRTVTARELLDAAARRVQSGPAGKPVVQATMLHTIGQVYGNLGMLDEAITLLRQALVMRGHIDPQSLGTAETAASLAASLRERGDWDEAQRAYETALTVMRQRYGARDIHVIVMLQGLAEVLSARGDLDSAEAAFRELLEALRRSPHGRGGLPGCLNALGGILSEKGENAEAIPLLREALQISRESQSGDWATLMAIRGNLAWLLALTGQNDEAESIIQDELAQRRRLLPPKHASIATSLITSAVIHMNRGRPIEAEPLFREAVEIRESALPANHPDVTEARGLLGDCLTKTRQYDEAERLLVACAQALRNTPGHSQTALAEADRRLIRLYEASGQTTKAESWRSRVQVQRSDSASRPAP